MRLPASEGDYASTEEDPELRRGFESRFAFRERPGNYPAFSLVFHLPPRSDPVPVSYWVLVASLGAKRGHLALSSVKSCRDWSARSATASRSFEYAMSSAALERISLWESRIC